MAINKRNNQSVVATVARAIELSEEALGQVARIAIEEIRCGSEANGHVEAAERHMRTALQQLVFAERELHARPAEPVTDAVQGAGADVVLHPRAPAG